VDIAAWLRGLGMPQYEAAFRDNAIDAAVLPEPRASIPRIIATSSPPITGPSPK